MTVTAYKISPEYQQSGYSPIPAISLGEYQKDREKMASHYCTLLIMRLGILLGENPHPTELAAMKSEIDNSKAFQPSRRDLKTSKESRLSGRVSQLDQKQHPLSSLFSFITFVAQAIGLISFTTYYAYTILQDFKMKEEIVLFKETLEILKVACDPEDNRGPIRSKYDANLCEKLLEILNWTEVFEEEHNSVEENDDKQGCKTFMIEYMIDEREKELDKKIEEKKYILAMAFIGGVGFLLGVKVLGIFGFASAVATFAFPQQPSLINFTYRLKLEGMLEEIKKLKKEQDRSKLKPPAQVQASSF